MVPFKNAELSLSPIKQATLKDRTQDNPAALTPWTCNGYLEHLTPGEAYMSYGVQLNSPAIAQIEVSDFLAAAAQNGFTTAVFALVPTNTGSPICGPVLSGLGAVAGVYAFTMTGAETFTGVDPDGNELEGGTLGVPYAASGLSFLASVGQVPCVAGDTFTITVSPNGSQFAVYMDRGQVMVTGAVGGQGSTIGNVYSVVGRPTSYDDGLPADHVMLILNQVMNPVGGAVNTQ